MHMLEAEMIGMPSSTYLSRIDLSNRDRTTQSRCRPKYVLSDPPGSLSSEDPQAMVTILVQFVDSIVEEFDEGTNP